MDRKFPECRELYVSYQRCFSKQSWTWGRAAGHVDDECEDAFDALSACVRAAVEAKQQQS